MLDHQGDKFFRELERSVVIGAARCQDRQPIALVPRSHEMVAGCLAGRVGAVGLHPVGFGKGRVVRPQAAKDLVGGNMQEANGAVHQTIIHES